MHEERYQIGALLGRGGMAEVFSGIDCQLRRPVAIKRLREDRALDPTLRARFRREATAAARLNHPGIVAVLDTAEVMPSTGSTPVPIIVMELIDGSSLRESLRDGPRLTPTEPWRSPTPFSAHWLRVTPRESSTATSSRPTSCSRPPERSRSPTSASPVRCRMTRRPRPRPRR